MAQQILGLPNGRPQVFKLLLINFIVICRRAELLLQCLSLHSHRISLLRQTLQPLVRNKEHHFHLRVLIEQLLVLVFEILDFFFQLLDVWA